MLVSGRGLGSFIIIMALTGATARAQGDLDQGKTGAQLFAANCVTCHRSPRGLAKDRFSLVLWNFMRQHYTSSASSAQTLTAYLESMDHPRSKPQRTTRTWRSSETGRLGPPPRPPLPAPTR